MSDVPMTEASAPGPLFLLRQAREASGLHIAALAAALKVPVKKLEALEAGRYDELPDMTFARALASSACRQLKVDPAPVLQQIPTAHGPQLGDANPSINAPFKGAHDRQPFNPAGWLSRPAVLAAIAVLLAALVLLLMPGGETPQADALMPPGSAPSAGPADVAPPIDSAAPPAVAAPGTPAAPPAPPAAPMRADTVDDLVPAATAVPSPAAASTPSTPSATVPSSTALLSIAVSGVSWVEVVNGQGSTVVQRMLKAGDVLDFSTAPPYSVVIGRADVAQVSVRGKAMDIAPYARNSVARFEVR